MLSLRYFYVKISHKSCTFAINMRFYNKTDSYKAFSIIAIVAVAVLQIIWLVNAYIYTCSNISNDLYKILESSLFEESDNRMKLVPDSVPIIASTEDSHEPNFAVLNEDLIKKTSKDLSMRDLCKIVHKNLLSHQIKEDFILYKEEKDTVIEQTQKDTYYIFGRLNTIPIFVRQSTPITIRLSLTNPYQILAKKLGITIIASFVVALLILISIFQQIRIIRLQKRIARERRDYTYAMIHDMKQPLTSIILGVKALMSSKIEEKPEDKVKFLGIMEQESYRLLAQTEKVLTIAKLENPSVEIYKTTVPLEPMIREVTDAYTLKAKKPVTFHLQIDAQDAYVEEDYFKEVMNNLIDNAVKYSKETVEVRISAEEQGNNTVIRIWDNGIGISEKDQRLIFEKFERADAVRKSKNRIAGFGLGLAYVRSVIHAHGGKVTVRSKLKKFTEFTITIPKESSWKRIISNC